MEFIHFFIEKALLLAQLCERIFEVGRRKAVSVPSKYYKYLKKSHICKFMRDFFGIIYDVCVHDFNVYYGAGVCPKAGKGVFCAQK